MYCVLASMCWLLDLCCTRGDLANHHTSSALDVETFGLVFRSNQVSWPLAYTRHGYAWSIGLKSLVLKARVPPPGLGNPVSDTIRFTFTDMWFDLQVKRTSMNIRNKEHDI